MESNQIRQPQASWKYSCTPNPIQLQFLLKIKPRLLMGHPRQVTSKIKTAYRNHLVVEHQTWIFLVQRQLGLFKAVLARYLLMVTVQILILVTLQTLDNPKATKLWTQKLLGHSNLLHIMQKIMSVIFKLWLKLTGLDNHYRQWTRAFLLPKRVKIVSKTIIMEANLAITHTKLDKNNKRVNLSQIRYTSIIHNL